MSQKQTLKTMLHEISHATLHRRKKNEPPSKDQHTREVEALYSYFYNVDFLNYFP